MQALERRRGQAITTLASAFAAGHVHEQTLEYRVEQALRARTLAALQAVTWDLPPLGRTLWQALSDRLGAPLARPAPSRISFRTPTEIAVPLDAGPRTYLVGRSRSCDIVLRDPAVSRRHAQLSVRGGRCSIRNLASTNGVEVNGRPITTAVLHAGDVVRLGGAVDALVR